MLTEDDPTMGPLNANLFSPTLGPEEVGYGVCLAGVRDHPGLGEGDVPDIIITLAVTKTLPGEGERSSVHGVWRAENL